MNIIFQLKTPVFICEIWHNNKINTVIPVNLQSNTFSFFKPYLATFKYGTVCKWILGQFTTDKISKLLYLAIDIKKLHVNQAQPSKIKTWKVIIEILFMKNKIKNFLPLTLPYLLRNVGKMKQNLSFSRLCLLNLALPNMVEIVSKLSRIINKMLDKLIIRNAKMYPKSTQLLVFKGKESKVSKWINFPKKIIWYPSTSRPRSEKNVTCFSMYFFCTI